MSVYLLDFFQPLPEAHTILDDRESFFWVIVYLCYRYLKNSLTPFELGDQLSRVFDNSTRARGRVGTGRYKRHELEEIAKDTEYIPSFKLQALKSILTNLARPFAARYEDPDSVKHDVYQLAIEKYGQDSPQARSIWQIWAIYLAHDPEWLPNALQSASNELLNSSKASADGVKGNKYHHNCIQYDSYAEPLQETKVFREDIGSLPFLWYFEAGIPRISKEATKNVKKAGFFNQSDVRDS